LQEKCSRHCCQATSNFFCNESIQVAYTITWGEVKTSDTRNP
jgi:hypothetical protein